MANEGDMRQRFLGNWRLVSWTRKLDARTVYPMGERATGFISYQADGRMFVEIMNAGRPRAASDTLGDFTDTEKVAAAAFLAYTGPFSVTDEKVTHHVEVSFFPNWVGTDLERAYRFLEDDNRLDLTAVIDGHTDHLLWERLQPTILQPR